jgi:cytochrome c-type biogenesis protein CcsB
MNFLINLVFGLFVFSTICYWIGLTMRVNSNILPFLTTGITIVANILLFAFLGYRWVKEGYFPLSNLYESLLFLTWCLTSVQLISEIKTSSKIIGSIITPLNLLLIGFSTSVLPVEMQKAAPLVPALQSNWLMLHVSMMMVSYATLILGSLLSILFLILSFGSREATKNYMTVRSDTSGALILDPEFDTSATYKNSISEIGKEKLLFNLDNWSYRTISLGFPCLTLGIISGAVWANEAWGSYWSWDPKETWALITWIVFASYIHARLTKNWQGQKAALLGSLGFFVVWVCYLGVNFLGKGLHSYGWLS